MNIYLEKKGFPIERLSLYDIHLIIKPNSYTAIIGHTGSGKSTY